MDYGMEEYTVTRWYEDGVLIKEEIKPVNEDKKKINIMQKLLYK